MNPVGIAAALATAVSWAACAMFFTSASRRIGSFSMNNWRVLFGTALLFIIPGPLSDAVALVLLLPWGGGPVHSEKVDEGILEGEYRRVDQHRDDKLIR